MAIRVRTTRKDFNGNTAVETFDTGRDYLVDPNGVLTIYNGEGDRLGSYAPEKWVSVDVVDEMKVDYIY